MLLTIAELWEVERHDRGVPPAWMTLQCSNLAYDGVAPKAWLQVGRRFPEQLSKRGKAARIIMEARSVCPPSLEMTNRCLRTGGVLYRFCKQPLIGDLHRAVTKRCRDTRAMRRQPCNQQPIAVPRTRERNSSSSAKRMERHR
jgi:hypothetical protein